MCRTCNVIVNGKTEPPVCLCADLQHPGVATGADRAAAAAGDPHGAVRPQPQPQVHRLGAAHDVTITCNLFKSSLFVELNNYNKCFTLPN